MRRRDGESGSDDWALTEDIIGGCIEVHRWMGPGLLESTYEVCLVRELALLELKIERQRPLVVEYKGLPLDITFRADLIVEDRVLVELKSVRTLLPVHEAQVLTQLRLANLETALLINFNVATLVHGVRRLRKPKKWPPDLPDSPSN